MARARAVLRRSQPSDNERLVYGDIALIWLAIGSSVAAATCILGRPNIACCGISKARAGAARAIAGRGVGP